MSDPRAGASLGSVSAGLSLAVQPIDGYTGRGPVPGVEVSIEGRDASPVRTPSGYRVFLDVAPGTVALTLDGGARFLDERVTDVDVIDLSAPGTTVDPGDPDTLPLETVELVPAPAYGFPATETLVRGTVRDPSGEPLGGATVSIVDRPAATRTAGNGEFVLFFETITPADVTEVDGRAVVVVDGGPPELSIDHTDHGTTTATLSDAGGDSTVVEGTGTSVAIEFP